MRIPKYWARAFHEAKDKDGATLKFSCVRWSEQSIADAKNEAARMVKQIAQRVLSGSAVSRYSYGDRPLREERIKEIAGADGQPAALVTRNMYGALVLNTSKVMFMDFDFPERVPFLTSIKRLFGRSPSAEQALLEHITEWARTQSRWGMRLYRTANGVRALVTHALFDPESSATASILTAAGCDPLYIKLCKTQQCFRARLTPKHWRCGTFLAPPNRYPWDLPSDEARYREWEKKYADAHRSYATCRFISSVGNPAIIPEAALIIQEHDSVACPRGELALA